MRDFWLQESLLGVRGGGCKNGSIKETIELQTLARSFLEVSNRVKCGHVTQAVLEIVVVE